MSEKDISSQPIEEYEPQYAPSDVIAVLDRLSEMIAERSTLPFSANVFVNQAEAIELLHNAREALPHDLLAADSIVADASKVLDKADAEAEAIRVEAIEQADAERADAESYAQKTTSEADEKAQITISEANQRAETIVEKARAQIEKELAEAKAKAEDLLQRAQARADELVSEEAVVKAANEKAQQTVYTGKQHAAKLAAEADAYVDNQLGELEEILTKVMRQTRAGRESLKGRK